MKKIILDTNFLIYCAKFKIDFFSEIERICNFSYRLYILDNTIKELEKVKPKELKLIKLFLKKIKVLKSKKENVDEELIRRSKENCIVATQDKELKSQLTNDVIIIKQKKYLELKHH